MSAKEALQLELECLLLEGLVAYNTWFREEQGAQATLLTQRQSQTANEQTTNGWRVELHNCMKQVYEQLLYNMQELWFVMYSSGSSRERQLSAQGRCGYCYHPI